MTGIRALLLLLAVLVPSRFVSGDNADPGHVEFFEKRIRPVLIRHCYECHSAVATEVKGGLRLDSRHFIREGGESGPAVVPGNLADSLLLGAMRHESFEMPPNEKLSDRVIADFETWIKAGAPDPRDHPASAKDIAELSWQSMLEERRTWWSLQPIDADVAKLAADLGRASSRVSPQIDAFIAAKKDDQGIPSAVRASARVLVRRLSLVLTGLPPAPEEVEQYVDDAARDSDAAYEALVDRLLSSPHFGEHWARHWMDVVRFAETHGYEWNHEIRDAWRYRDYLIRAFNDDVPYDQLVREHIAGDLLEQPRVNEQQGIDESVIGTAFWRFGELGHDDCVEFPEIRFDSLDNQIDTLGKAFQGLTISCARCHDHKVDAISTRDYYALVGMLEGCAQVVHTIDSPQRIAGDVARARQLRTQIRKQLANKWLRAVEQSRNVIAAAISDESGADAKSNALKEYIAESDLKLSDPGAILKRLSRREGPAGAGSEVSTSDLRNAHWLWYPEGNAAVDAPIASRYFRHRLIVPEDRRVTKAWCLFAGDDRVSLYLNGVLIGTGVSHSSLVGVDVTGQLKGGVNEVAVLNTNEKAAVKENPAGWIGVVRVEFEEGDPQLIYSNSSWKCSRTVNAGWQTGDFGSQAWIAAMELGRAGSGPWGYPWPEHVHVRRRMPLRSLWPLLRQEYLTEHERRTKFNAENFQVWVDFSSGDTSWSTTGLGLSAGPNRSGEFTLNREGGNVIDAILPAGLHTNVTSDRLNGSLRSPWLPTKTKYISVQVAGDRRSMVRTVVDSCALNEFAGGGLHYLNDGATKWKRFPCSTGESSRSLVELTTRADNPRWPDRPGRAGSADPEEVGNPRSWFGVTRAVLHDTEETPLAELTHIVPLFGKSDPSQYEDEFGIAVRFQTLARSAVEAWAEDRATDADVYWLNWLLRTGLLPNSIDGDEELTGLLREYRALDQEIPEPRVIAGLSDHGRGHSFPVLRGGDPSDPLDEVPPGFIEVIVGSTQRDDARGSGRRELAEVIAGAGNPLTARVMVNRIWHHLFGRGIVATPDDFGGMGELPTHPELLDFLAAGFADDGWSVKRLIRRIVLSRTFQQSSLPVERAVDLDPGNQLLHYFPARRLDAESIRDTIIAVSGRLDPALYGPGIQPYRRKEIDYRKLFSGPLDGAGRRSIYTKVTRMEGPQFLELFDFPNPMATRGKRDRTNVPAQALAMLNDPFVIEQARHWGDRLVADDHDSIGDRVRTMFRQALGRPPTETEQQRFVTLVRQLADSAPDQSTILQDAQVWQDAAHAVFNMKELIYIR